MTFTWEISISDIISFVTFLLAFISVIIALKQYGRSVALKRADYINELTGEIRTDEDIRDIVYLLDYGEIWYTEEFHKSKELERKMDKTLSYFSYIAYLRKSKLLSGKEFEFFEYEIKRILINAGVRDYFYNLYHFAKHNDVPFTFAYLLDYGTKNYSDIFDNEFFDNTTWETKRPASNGMRYNHYLNF